MPRTPLCWVWRLWCQNSEPCEIPNLTLFSSNSEQVKHKRWVFFKSQSHNEESVPALSLLAGLIFYFILPEILAWDNVKRKGFPCLSNNLLVMVFPQEVDRIGSVFCFFPSLSNTQEHLLALPGGLIWLSRKGPQAATHPLRCWWVLPCGKQLKPKWWKGSLIAQLVVGVWPREIQPVAPFSLSDPSAIWIRQLLACGAGKEGTETWEQILKSLSVKQALSVYPETLQVLYRLSNRLPGYGCSLFLDLLAGVSFPQ